MNQQSLASFSKITVEMDRLSFLINKEQLINQQIQQVLKYQDRSSDSEQSNNAHLDLYFKQYDNPTTKSLPFQSNQQPSSQMLDEESQTNTIYRNQPVEDSEDGDRQNLHDDKSTVILAGLKSQLVKQKEELPVFLVDNSKPNYSSVNVQVSHPKREGLQSKSKKGNQKYPSNSMASEIFIVKQSQKNQVNVVKNNSVSKLAGKTQSPLLYHSKNKKPHNEAEYENSNLIKQLKGKLSKMNKLDREQLNRLQQKKVHKKNEPSSHRKKTKRELLGNAKSAISIANHSTKFMNTATNYLTHKTPSNSSCKRIEKTKKEAVKREQKVLLNYQDWQMIEKQTKKLNRVNIYKLQQNIKKGNEKNPLKDISISKLQKKSKINQKFNSHHKEHNQLKLHFTEGEEECCMKKLIEEKQLDKEYKKQTEKYLEIVKKMTRSFFQSLMKQCRETSQEAVLKLKLVSLILYFFDQYTSTSLLSNKNDSKNQDFFRRVAEQQIIEVLLHPKQILKVIQNLPSILMKNNVISAERFTLFNSKFNEINEQLDQQLQFFLIKKSLLYTFAHSLYQYISFLIQKDLLAQTKRTKIAAIQPQQCLYGYYSSRSKKEDVSHKYIKKNDSRGRTGYRCDSDRKMTVEDEQMCFKDIRKIPRKQSSMPSMKANLGKKAHK